MRMARAFFCVMVSMAVAGMAAAAAPLPPDHPPVGAASQKGDGPGAGAEKDGKTMPGEKPSVTTGVLNSVSGEKIPYTATAGYMALNDEQGKLRANMFYISYLKGTDKEAGTQPAVTETAGAGGDKEKHAFHGDSQRPITFLFNGGPGSASVWLHLGAAGPKRIEMPDDGTAP